MDQPFLDRVAAGKHLASALRRHAVEGTLVLATPRGGMTVGSEVAHALRAELDLVAVRAIAAPPRGRVQLGAVVSGGSVVLWRAVLAELKVRPTELQEMAYQELAELMAEERQCRGNRPPSSVVARRVLLVDDGLTPCSNLRAVLAALRAAGPAHLSVALPITTPETSRELARLADELFLAEPAEPYHAEALWYRSASSTTHAEVRSMLEAHRQRLAAESGISCCAGGEA